MKEKCAVISVSRRLVLVLHDQAELDQTLKTSASWDIPSWNIWNSECWRGFVIWFFGFNWEVIWRRRSSKSPVFRSGTPLQCIMHQYMPQLVFSQHFRPFLTHPCELQVYSRWNSEISMDDSFLATLQKPIPAAVRSAGIDPKHILSHRMVAGYMDVFVTPSEIEAFSTMSRIL